MSVGIDKAAFYTSPYYLDLRTLAKARGVDPNKFTVGLGQQQMAVSPPDEDIVTLGANAAYQILLDEDIKSIDTLLFATETGIDQSKAAGILVHRLLKLSPRCRVVELKQACYSGTAALQMAMDQLRVNPSRKILLIASDIARYGLNTAGESSQGGGAVAMLLTANPRMIAIEPEAGFVTEDAWDFWRPNYRDEALVDGKYSCDLYLKILREAWQHYSEQSNRDYDAHQHFCFHIPIPRLAEKALQKLALINGKEKPVGKALDAACDATLEYSRTIGNCYTASLYLGLLSLLDNDNADLTNHRIGFYSYGSGCTAEFFSAVVQPSYRNVRCKAFHQQLLKRRRELTQQEYEYFYNFSYPRDGSSLSLPKSSTGRFRLASLNQHQRHYKTNEAPCVLQSVPVHQAS